MLYKVVLALLMSLELVFVLISLKYLHQSNVISKEFAAIFGKSKEEVQKLFQEIKDLSEISSKKENYTAYEISCRGDTNVCKVNI